MPDKEKCKLLKKKAKGKYYYKCKPVECDKECLIYVLWQHIEEAGVIGTSVQEVGCECLTFDRWDGRDAGPGSCKAEMGRVKPVEKEGKKYEKTIIHCLNDGCTKECVFFIKYKNPNKELGPIVDAGCECVNWDAL